MPTRCAAAPSSTGGGILLQSSSSRFLWFILFSSSATEPDWVQAAHPCCETHAFGVPSGWGNDTLSAGPHQAAFLPAPIALLLAFALVVKFFALGHRQKKLGAAAFVEIKFERDQRHAFAIDRAHEPIDLLSVQQELARTFRLVVEAVALQIFRDVGVDQPNLAVLG